jgi:excisionase family DNA binding protein
MREIMTPEQVAEYLQLNTDTVYRLIRQNQLAASQIGRAYRIPKEDVENFLLTHSTRPQVRKALFDRVMGIAPSNPELNSDEVLDDLEELDRKRMAKPQPAKNG